MRWTRDDYFTVFAAPQQAEVAEQHSPLPEQQSTFFTLALSQHGLPSKQHGLPSKQQLSLSQHGLPSKQQAAPGVQHVEDVECDPVARTPPSSALRVMATPTNSFANMDFLQ